MAFAVIVTDLANEDPRQAVQHIAQDNPTAAAKLGYAILDRIKLLRDFPWMGRVVPERDDPTLREVIHKPYRIIYRVKTDQHLVEVWRIWHGARGEPVM
ncbi:MAG: type II toxin-antitoxin system RelE/ParE family toxin [Verrucomicrobia bacterium]|nr:type II toxin-antitoxin system RelE/ParE family toxin [Verrucomicrobiota bacterium]